MTLSNLQVGQSASIVSMPSNHDITAHLMEQGFTVSTIVTLMHKAPFSGLIAVAFDGTKVAISRSLAKQIGVVVE